MQSTAFKEVKGNTSQQDVSVVVPVPSGGGYGALVYGAIVSIAGRDSLNNGQSVTIGDYCQVNRSGGNPIAYQPSNLIADVPFPYGAYPGYGGRAGSIEMLVATEVPVVKGYVVLNTRLSMSSTSYYARVHVCIKYELVKITPAEELVALLM